MGCQVTQGKKISFGDDANRDTTKEHKIGLEAVAPLMPWLCEEGRHLIRDDQSLRP